MYTLTEEGKIYLKKGMPERRLIKLLARKPLPIKDLKGMGIAINWARKNDWIEVKEGKVYLTNKGKSVIGRKYDLELALSDFSKGRKIKEDLLRILIKRKLIKELKKYSNIAVEKEIAQLTPEIIISGAWKKSTFKKYDINSPAPEIFPGKKQAYRAFLDEVKQELVAMGFKEMTGPTVESVFFNCDALYMPQDHPARGIHDIYFVKGKTDIDEKLLHAVKNVHERGGFGSKGWKCKFSIEVSKKLLLRSQGTAESIRTLASRPDIPGKYFSIARVYRPDVVDSTHLTEFNQLDGIILGRDVNFRELLGMLKMFAEKIAGTSKVKFLPGYFPFTEPSVEGYVFHPRLKKWIEVLPAGIIRPEVTGPVGINVPVIAWGLGIDRLFMIRENIDDIRYLFSYDLKWLRERRI